MDSEQKLLKIPQVARVLNVSRATVYKLLESQELRSVHIGTARRVPLHEMQRWLDQKSAVASVSYGE